MPSDTTHPDLRMCTCFSIYTWDHDFDCDLWESPGFAAGLLEWDDEHHQLVPKSTDYYQLSDEEVAEMAGMYPDEAEATLEDLSELKGRVFVAGPDGGLVEVDDNYEPPFEEPGPVQQGLFEKMGDRLKAAVLGKKDPPKQEWDLIECTCTPKNAPGPNNHNGKCKLWNYPPWVYQECEWDHKNRRLMWYEAGQEGGLGVATRLQPPMGGPKNKTIDKKDKDTIGSSTGYTSSYVPKDRHKEHEVTFPDGTKVLGSSSFWRKADESAPDYGLYMADSWKASSIATYIPWTDHGLPTIPWHHVVASIVDHFEKAKAGFTVELGCIGGHGRTGTVMACMAILGGVAPDEACAWVWDNYCEHAIESDSQIWFIEWFASKVTDWPEPMPTDRLYTSVEPKPAPKPIASSTGKTDHNGKKGTPNKDVPYCGQCGEPRWEDQTYLCNKSGCMTGKRNNYTARVDSDVGKQALDEWRGKGKNANPPKAKTPPKSTAYYQPAITEKSGVPEPPGSQMDDFVPFCPGCNTTRFLGQEFLCRNPRCKPNYTIPVDTPRGERLLTRWRNARAYQLSSPS